jgi:hypothetical protein
MTSRRDLIKTGAMAAITGAVPSSVTFADTRLKAESRT